MKYRNLYILAIAIIILLNLNTKVQPQTVAPSCFVTEDCYRPVMKGYCDVKYDCIVGSCYFEDIRCPEICYGGKDEDMDGLIDCKDTDCFNSEYCYCGQMSFLDCVPGRCYCPTGNPVWAVYGGGGHECQCK